MESTGRNPLNRITKDIKLQILTFSEYREQNSRSSSGFREHHRCDDNSRESAQTPSVHRAESLQKRESKEYYQSIGWKLVLFIRRICIFYPRYYVLVISVVSWTKGLRDTGWTINNVAKEPKRRVNVPSVLQLNSFLEKAYVNLATSGCGTRGWWD